jgi:hypothetical protein
MEIAPGARGGDAHDAITGDYVGFSVSYQHCS